MNQISCLTVAVLGAVFLQSEFLPLASADEKPAIDIAKIEAATGLKGSFNKAENVFKVSKPRTDVTIRVDDWQMPPFMGLTSWAAFTPAPDGQSMMMGDTVLFEDEVNPVMSAALESGLEVTALHNHFFFDEPKVYFMHIGGMGETGALGAGVRKVYDKVAEIRAVQPTPQKVFMGGKIGSPSMISPAPLEALLGIKGQAKGGMFKVVIGRPAAMRGVSIGSEMGVNTWAAFAGTDDEAVIDGDFAMTERELQTVLRAMRTEGIDIVAIHQHMSQEEPRILFLHYWGKGKAASLAQSLENVLKAQAAVAR
jgi:hypothetical protein